MKAKIQELKAAIGKTVSFNSSPTLRAKLLKVNKKSCIMEVMPTEWECSRIGSEFVGDTFKAPIEHTWNAIYY
jgi:hypothetical protein